MKNYEQLIMEASVVISEYVKNHANGFDLFFVDGFFVCHATCKAELMDSFVRHFTVTQAKIGLTSAQWLRLGKKASKLQSEN